MIDIEALDPAEFARLRLGFQPDRHQEELLGVQGRRCIVNCTRQWGKSTVTSVMAVHRAHFYPDSLILVISPSARQSAEFLRKCSRHLRKLQIKPRGDGDNDISLLLPNNSRIVGLPHTEDRVRGFSSVSLLVIDEASRVEDKLYHAVRPMVAVGGRDGRGGDMWLMSTPNGKRGFFWDVWSKGGPEWTRICVPANECPRISAEFLAEERGSNSDRFFRQEYMCEFVDREDGAFREAWIESAIFADVPTLEATDSAHDPNSLGWDEKSRRFFIGLDLGQRQDHTAIAVVERCYKILPDIDPATRMNRRERHFRCRHAQRLPLGLSYTEIVEYLRAFLRQPVLTGRSALIVDASGVGAPVLEMLRGVGAPVEGVTITAGQNFKSDDYGWKAPRRELLAILALMMEQKELQISGGIKDLDKLVNELRNLRLTQSSRGQERYQPELDSVHDDLAIALSLACWKARRTAGPVQGTHRLFY